MDPQPNKYWSTEKEQRLSELHEAGHSAREIGRILNRTRGSISNKLQNLRTRPGQIAPGASDQHREEVAEQVAEMENSALETEIQSLKSQISNLEKSPPSLSGVEPVLTDKWDGPEEWSRAEDRAVQDIRRAELLGKFRVKFDNGPIAICAMSDQHIAPGSPVDLKRMREDAELVRDTPGFYAMLGGDGVDNHMKHRSAMLAAGSRIDDQWKLFDHYLTIFAEKILVVISGNHDAWTPQNAGVDVLSRIAESKRLCYSPAEARIAVTVGKTRYDICLRHQYRYNSSFNLNHAVKRLFEMSDEPFDIGVICHHHEANLEAFLKHGKIRYGARPGSYQMTSGYSRQYGFNNAYPTCHTFILFPDERRIIGFNDVRDALWAWKGAGLDK